MTIVWIILIAMLILVALAVVLLVILLLRSGGQRAGGFKGLELAFAQLKDLEESLQKTYRQYAEQTQMLLSSQRGELQQSFRTLGESQQQTYVRMGATQQQTMMDLGAEQRKYLTSFKEAVERLGTMQIERFQEQIARLTELREGTDNKLKEMRTMVETRLTALQTDNAKKLEEMRQTVDEKLQATVEQRFDQSFKLISQRLEAVQKGLGEMQSLAVGVGDLKRVLTNVKMRGNLGEVQLGSILADIMAPEQYVQNAHINPQTQEVVEYAVKFPGRSPDSKPLLLPIDSKFPLEDYRRLLEAYELTDDTRRGEVERTGRLFEQAIRKAADDIQRKYILPPVTTDFAILFVPTEGLYAEIVKRTDLFESLRQNYHVLAVGPTNLAALLNCLSMGFRTLTIEKHTSEVWTLLGAVKTEFSKFGAVLEKTKKKLTEASNVIDGASQRTRVINRKLRGVGELTPEASRQVLELEPVDDPLELQSPTPGGEL